MFGGIFLDRVLYIRSDESVVMLPRFISVGRIIILRGDSIEVGIIAKPLLNIPTRLRRMAKRTNTISLYHCNGEN